MYIPKHYTWEDKGEIIAFMMRYNFALIITAGHDMPFATHLPFHIEEREEKLFLTAHFAVATPQWKMIEGANVLVSLASHTLIYPLRITKKKKMYPPGITWPYTLMAIAT